MVTLVCLQTNVCQTWALHFVGFQTSGALNEGLFLSREFLEEIVPCFMALFPVIFPSKLFAAEEQSSHWVLK